MALTAEAGRRKWEANFQAWTQKCGMRHANKYRYQSMERVREGSAWKVSITCPDHGTFLQAPEKHAFGQGCPMCDGKGVDKVAHLRALFPGFAFPDARVEGSKQKFPLVCPLHGEFHATYNNLTMRATSGMKSPCPKCNKARSGELRRKTGELWAKQVASATGGKVALQPGRFTTAGEKAEFVCSEHGAFVSVLQDVVTGHGCPECGRLQRNRTNSQDVESFISAARAVHGDRYEYDKEAFVSSRVPTVIVCAKHGPFQQRPNNHVFGAAGCPQCAKSVSSGEAQMIEWLEELGLDVRRRDRTTLEGKEIDLLLPEQRLGIEYCGLYWHGEYRKPAAYHQEKLEAAVRKGIRLLTVFEDEWLDVEQRGKVMSRVLVAIGKCPTIYARNTRVLPIAWAVAKEFLDTHHMQGAGVPAKVCYGLYLGDEIVAASTWGLSRFGKTAQWELLRFCSSGSSRVVGGMGKMFATFVRGHAPTSVVSYADRRWGDGACYGKVGFKFDGITAPGYFWCKHSARFSRQQFQKHKLGKALASFDPAASETENCRANGYWRIYDCGHARWIWQPADTTLREGYEKHDQ